MVWFYSALTFHSIKSTASDEASLRLSIVKELFQLLVSCTSCTDNAAMKVAVLAPVIYELCRLVLEKKCSRKEVESLLERVVGYIGICRGADFDKSGECEVLSSCFPDLVHIWVIGKVGDVLGLFFPAVDPRARERLVNEGCAVGSLAGVVMIECFLLSLCLKFGCGISTAALQKELCSSAVQMIEAFRSYHFIDTLLWMLLDPVLPAISLVNYEDEVLLREILYDAVTVVGSSFFGPGKDMQLPIERLKDLAVTWLFVADNAIRFVRESGEPMKGISYLQAFSRSCLPSKLMQWVKNQCGVESQRSIPNVSTPLALIKASAVSFLKWKIKLLDHFPSGYTMASPSGLKRVPVIDNWTILEWLLIVEDQGVRVFDGTISKIYAKAIICKLRLECDFSMPDGKSFGYNDLSHIGFAFRGMDAPVWTGKRSYARHRSGLHFMGCIVK